MAHGSSVTSVLRALGVAVERARLSHDRDIMALEDQCGASVHGTPLKSCSFPLNARARETSPSEHLLGTRAILFARSTDVWTPAVPWLIRPRSRTPLLRFFSPAALARARAADTSAIARAAALEAEVTVRRDVSRVFAPRPEA